MHAKSLANIYKDFQKANVALYDLSMLPFNVRKPEKSVMKIE